ncbi:UNVERIFIED_CONTAM: LINE-1 reverse transcriptase [Sesamum latifolium]|uniref:LINE-1 reverse transcriptase n=1 Tax=Sesamum latifolium TaxID=2727402 RepID=A0AAW2XRA3_9LAMI
MVITGRTYHHVCALKVDLPKAYDTLEWDFIHAMLSVFGFPEKMIMWIVECISTTTYSFALNGELHGFFPGARGIRQAESFQYHWQCNEMKLFNLCFADDLLLFCKAEENSEGQLPVRYLGLPLISSRLTIDDCKPLLLKVDERLQGWSSLHLSFAARIQLLKSVISALNIYWATTFILPYGVLKTIEACMRKFLWQAGHNSGAAKVAWVDVCTSVTARFGWLGEKWSWSWRKILKLRSQLLGPLIHRFPNGPRVTGIPLESKVSLVINEHGWSWPLITDIEHMEIVDHLPRLEDSDGVRWNSTTGEFTISDAYRLFQPPGPTVGWHVLLRGPLRIPRNCFILWLAILERLSTLDRTWWTGLDSTCVLCSRGETESHSHLFFQCEYANTCLRILEAEVRFRLPRISWQHTVLWSARRCLNSGMPFPVHSLPRWFRVRVLRRKTRVCGALLCRFINNGASPIDSLGRGGQRAPCHTKTMNQGIGINKTSMRLWKSALKRPNLHLPTRFQLTSIHGFFVTIIHDLICQAKEFLHIEAGLELSCKITGGLNSVAHQAAVGQLVRDNKIQFMGLLERRVRQEVDVEILRVEVQFIHCKLTNRRMHTSCLISVIYGDCDLIRHRELWAGLRSLSEEIIDDPWCVLGDFNVVIDASEGALSPGITAVKGAEACGNVWTRWSMKHGFEGSTEQGFFKFDNFLAKQPGFLNVVRSTWRHPINGTRMYGVVCKLKALKSTFRAQRKVKGDLANNVTLAKEFLDRAQALFDRKINARRARQRIYQITNSAGVILTDTSQSSLRHILTMEEAIELTMPVTAAEIKEAFFDISEDSTPGPDGYPSAFYKATWPKIGADLCAAITEFFHSGRLLKQINATLLVLIPKVQLPVRVSDYRPIACCNVIYKVITKILVRRMQLIFHLLIDHTQTAFVPRSSISDNVLLAQELLARYNQARLPRRCTIKVDIQKAYDSVHWDFILEGLRIFNFPPRFIGWIEQCITTISFSVSLNESMHGFFQGSRAIRQGDPMSPYLFVIVMELWHVLLKIRVQNAATFQFHWKCKELGILNLCFADDVLIFCSGNVQSTSTIKDTLAEFAGMSGLQVNPSKSQIILSKAVQTERQAILDLMGFQESSHQVSWSSINLFTTHDCRLSTSY